VDKRVMVDAQTEAEWRAEFELIGEAQVSVLVCDGIIPEPKRQAGFRWLGDQAQARRAREERTFNYVRWTFFAAVAAVLVGIIGIASTLMH
jgi:hypothetical protein